MFGRADVKVSAGGEAPSDHGIRITLPGEIEDNAASAVEVSLRKSFKRLLGTQRTRTAIRCDATFC